MMPAVGCSSPALALAIAVALAPPAAAAPDGPVTYTRDVAPILFTHCAVCHRPGAAGPFTLLSYRDARKRARQIAMVTGTRYMPPWLPAPSEDVTFRGDRSLTAKQIAVIQQWVADGAVEGDPADLPPVPHWSSEWQLGPPDLVLTMPQPFTLRADGPDVFRDFVIPVPIDETKYVRGVEFRPGNRRAVHHVIIEIDPTGASRRLDAKDEEPGYEGMISGDSVPPDGHFIGWTSGKMPALTDKDMAWQLPTGSDLILQLHMLPTGKTEQIQCSLGLYFADRPPTRHPFMILMGNFDIDIPAGAKDYTVTDSYVLPVDVDALRIYPHAHYLGKHLQAYAVLPDGRRQGLIDIPNWDFNWQDDYDYAEPVFLPRGARLVMNYSFDNTADNVRNPHSPPQRVVYGNSSLDEMSTYLLQVLPRNPDDLAVLARDFDRKFPLEEIVRLEGQLGGNPEDPDLRTHLAFLYLRVGERRRAQVELEEAVRLDPDNSPAHDNLALICRGNGRLDLADEHFRRSLKADATNISALNNYAWFLATCPDEQFRDGAKAVEHARRAEELLQQDSAAVLDTLAAAYAAAGDFEQAVRTARLALGLAASPKRRALASQIRLHLSFYTRGAPFIEKF